MRVDARSIRALVYLGAFGAALSLNALLWHADSCLPVGKSGECAVWIDAYCTGARTLVFAAVPIGLGVLVLAAAAWASTGRFPAGSNLLRWWCVVTFMTGILVSCTLPKIF